MVFDLNVFLLSSLQGISVVENKYVLSVVILIFALIFSQLVLLIFNLYLRKIAKRTQTQFDDLLFAHTQKPIFYLILVYGLKLATVNIGINGVISTFINSVLAVMFVFLLMRVLDSVIEGWGRKFAEKTESKVDEMLLPLFHKIAKVIFVIIGLMWVLHIWGVDITPYLAGVGISGIILGLALQDTLKNVFGGINLLLDKTYNIGDKIQLESGDKGTIVDIGLRSTKLITFDNELVYVPNGYLANSRVKNYARPDERVRVRVEFSIEYGTDIEKVRKIVLAAVSTMANVLKQPKPAVHFLTMGDFALKFRVVFWVSHWDKEFGEKEEATTKIYNAFDKAKIKIPFPTQVVYLKKK